jgi:hypothetical protein
MMINIMDLIKLYSWFHPLPPKRGGKKKQGKKENPYVMNGLLWQVRVTMWYQWAWLMIMLGFGLWFIRLLNE